MSSSSALFAPVDNLLRSIIALARHPADPIKAIDNIMRQPKDEHGNIVIALDDKNMSLWRAGVQELVPNAIFKPIVIVTNPAVIQALLNELKSDAGSHFAGNPSTDTIGSLVGTDNIFASTNKDIHSVHKLAFKDYLSDQQKNIDLIAPVVRAWVETMSQRTVKDEGFELLAASIMLTFLFGRELAFDSQCVADVITLKRHFVRTATLSDGLARFFDGYEGAKRRLAQIITERYHSANDSYIKTLSAQFGLPQTISHILSLMMVGFDNLRSSLISTVIQLAKHPEYRMILQDGIQYDDRKSTAFINFDLIRRESAASQFFADALQQTPPVWLQARVNKAESVIGYRDGTGEHSFILPASALVLIPNLHLALLSRQAAKRSSDLFPHPFSIGPNACPGRPIAYAANGVLIATLIKNNVGLALSPLSNQQYDPKVALSLKNLQLYVGYSDGQIQRLIMQDKAETLPTAIAITILSLSAAILAAMLSDYRKNSVSVSMVYGAIALSVTALLCVDLLAQNKLDTVPDARADTLPEAPRLR